MARTSIDLDETACTAVLRRYGLTTMSEAVNFALHEMAGVLTVDQARELRGSGWEGDLDEIRRTHDPSRQID